MSIWQLFEEGEGYGEVEAADAAAALQVACANVDRANYGDGDATLWIDVRVSNPETGEAAEAEVQLDPEPPRCTSPKGHQWEAPWPLVGGLKENPGVWGHGAGVILHRVCPHCGTRAITDTWATRPDTGVQGYTTVRYAPEEEAPGYDKE